MSNEYMVQVNNVMLGVCQPQEFSHLNKKKNQKIKNFNEDASKT